MKTEGYTNKLRTLFLAAALAAILPHNYLHAEEDPFEGFAAYIETAMTQWQVPGLAIVVMHEDQIIYSKAFGVREAGKSDPVDLDTVFALSSTGKAYTATLAATVIDEGKLDWDDPVSEYLDYFQLPDPWVTRQVTIRDLLSHRLAGDLGVGKLELWAFTGLGRDEVLSRLRYLEIGSPRFRGQFQYSNPNISAAGQAVGVAMGERWDDLMQDRILNGLGMGRASTSVLALWAAEDIAACYMCDLDHLPGSEDARIDNIAMPHIASPDGPKPIPWRTVDDIGPAGSINSSVLDFARFVQLHLNQGEINGRRVVSESQVAEMHSPQMIVRSPPYAAVSGFSEHWAYGLGWFLTEYRGRKLVMHTGGITGWRSGMVMLPEERLGVAMVSNSHGAHLPNTLVPALAFSVFDRVLGLGDVDHSAEWLHATKNGLKQLRDYEASLLEQKDGTTGPGIESDRMAGRWTHPAFGEMNLDPDNGRIRFAGVIDGALEHWRDDLYRVTWIGPWPYTTFLTVGADEVELHGFGVFNRPSE
jgi:CubicO group peptidase (beta-lactamase class C family)